MAMSPSERRPLSAGWGVPVGSGLGGALGLVVGIAFGQLAIGLAIGAALGLVGGAILTTGAATPPDQRRGVVTMSLAIVAVGVVAMLVILLR